MANVEERLQQLETQVDGVARLASATAKGTGKDRAGRVVVCFGTGAFKESILDCLRQWETGAEAARLAKAEGGAASGAAGTGNEGGKPPPLKMQLFTKVVEQLVRQGVGEPVASTLRHTRQTAVESAYCKKPEATDERPVIFTISFKGNIEGLAARGALDSQTVRDAIAKRGGTWLTPWPLLTGSSASGGPLKLGAH